MIGDDDGSENRTNNTGPTINSNGVVCVVSLIQQAAEMRSAGESQQDNNSNDSPNP